jgi:hypothetical protein
VEPTKDEDTPRGLRFDALREFKKQNGIEQIVATMSADFDEPLSEDFLLKPFPQDE